MELARAHLKRARQAVRAGDYTAAVTWSNLCAETAVDYLAKRHRIDTRMDHFTRTSAARRLFDKGVLSEDLTPLMIRLNNERKHANYEGRTPDLRGRSWDDVLRSLDRLVRAAASA